MGIFVNLTSLLLLYYKLKCIHSPSAHTHTHQYKATVHSLLFFSFPLPFSPLKTLICHKIIICTPSSPSFFKCLILFLSVILLLNDFANIMIKDILQMQHFIKSRLCSKRVHTVHSLNHHNVIHVQHKKSSTFILSVTICVLTVALKQIP